MADPLAIAADDRGTRRAVADRRRIPRRRTRRARSRSRSRTPRVDKEHIVLIRDSVQGERQQDAGDLVRQARATARARSQDAIENGCPKRLTLNTRRTRAPCTRAPSGDPLGLCRSSSRATRPAQSLGLGDRFACTPNNWVHGGSPGLSTCDQRWAYIFLTSFGRMYASQGTTAGFRSRGSYGSTSPAGTRRTRVACGVQRRSATRLRRQGSAALGPPRRPASPSTRKRDRRRRRVRPDAQTSSSASRRSSDDAAAGRKTEPTAGKN